MTGQEIAQLALGWLTLGAAIGGMISVRGARWSWAAAAALASGWVAITQSAGLGAALAGGTMVAIAAEGSGQPTQSEFSRLTRHLALTVAALGATVVILVRLAHVDASQAPFVFPILATAVIALVAAFSGAEQAEIHRAARLLLVMAALGWTTATSASQPAAAVAVAGALPLLALTGRLEPPPAESETAESSP